MRARDPWIGALIGVAVAIALDLIMVLATGDSLNGKIGGSLLLGGMIGYPLYRLRLARHLEEEAALDEWERERAQEREDKPPAGSN